MEDNSLYWWKVSVLLGATAIMLLVHLNKEVSKDNSLNYAVSYVIKSKMLAVRPVKKNVVAVKESAISKVEKSKSINKEGKAKVLAAYLRNRRIGRGITNSRVIISETSIASVAPHKSYNKKAEEKVQTYAKASKRPINDINSKFVSQNNISLSSTADYKVVNSEKNQELINSNNITINQSNDIETEMTNGSSSQSISTLLKTYNQYQSIRNSTISYTVDGNLEFVDITSTDLISNQVPESNINSPLASKPMGAKNAEDPLDGGGGVDNGTVYNDSGGGPSLPVGDGTLFLIGLSIIFISFKNFKHNFKIY